MTRFPVEVSPHSRNSTSPRARAWRCARRLLDGGELQAGRGADFDFGARTVALDLAEDADVLTFERFRGEAELAAVGAVDACGEGVAREHAAHVQEGRFAFRALRVLGLFDLAAHHAVLADEARRHFRRNHFLRLSRQRGSNDDKSSDGEEREQELHRDSPEIKSRTVTRCVDAGFIQLSANRRST
ncbi:hypothetical protein XAC2852_370021 [Xanthomonas citri pv. citri]|nr:hypothetical protein XAC2852_370021 [Xanthomonas citri pv. citri]